MKIKYKTKAQGVVLKNIIIGSKLDLKVPSFKIALGSRYLLLVGSGLVQISKFSGREEFTTDTYYLL